MYALQKRMVVVKLIFSPRAFYVKCPKIVAGSSLSESSRFIALLSPQVWTCILILYC